MEETAILSPPELDPSSSTAATAVTPTPRASRTPTQENDVWFSFDRIGQMFGGEESFAEEEDDTEFETYYDSDWQDEDDSWDLKADEGKGGDRKESSFFDGMAEVRYRVSSAGGPDLAERQRCNIH